LSDVDFTEGGFGPVGFFEVSPDAADPVVEAADATSGNTEI